MNNSLLYKVTNRINLYQAAVLVKYKNGVAGIDEVTANQAERYLDNHIDEIIQSLEEETFRPQYIRQVSIPKPNGGLRMIGLPTVRDKIIQLAIVNVLSPIYEKQFSDDSYGFRPNRSIHQAITKAQEYMNDGFTWIVAMDLSKFFDMIHHDKLMSEIFKTIKDEKILHLIRLFLQTESVYHGRIVIRTPNLGAIQGGNISPLLANIYLDTLDRELTRRDLYFTRYADDVTIFLKTKESAQRVLSNISKFIEDKLFLQINHEKTIVANPVDVNLLGFNFYIDKGEYKSCIPNKSIQKMNLTTINKIDRSITINKAIKAVNDELRGWTSNYQHADKAISFRQAKAIDRMILEKLYGKFKPDMTIGKFRNTLYPKNIKKKQLQLVSMEELWRVIKDN